MPAASSSDRMTQKGPPSSSHEPSPRGGGTGATRRTCSPACPRAPRSGSAWRFCSPDCRSTRTTPPGCASSFKLSFTWGSTDRPGAPWTPWPTSMSSARRSSSSRGSSPTVRVIGPPPPPASPPPARPPEERPAARGRASSRAPGATGGWRPSSSRSTPARGCRGWSGPTSWPTAWTVCASTSGHKGSTPWPPHWTPATGTLFTSWDSPRNVSATSPPRSARTRRPCGRSRSPHAAGGTIAVGSAWQGWDATTRRWPPSGPTWGRLRAGWHRCPSSWPARASSTWSARRAHPRLGSGRRIWSSPPSAMSCSAFTRLSAPTTPRVIPAPVR